MISGVFGLPGSGKTMFLSCLAERAINKHNIFFPFQNFGTVRNYKRVYTSFPCPDCYSFDYTELGVKHFSDCLFLIDEISMYSDARQYKSFSDELKFFYTQHRKFNIDIIYCSQSYADCDLKIRNVTDSLYYITRSIGDWSLVRPIRAYFRIQDGQIKQGYELDSPIFNFYFNRKRQYGRTDTTFYLQGKAKYSENLAPTCKLWLDK